MAAEYTIAKSQVSIPRQAGLEVFEGCRHDSGVGGADDGSERALNGIQGEKTVRFVWRAALMEDAVRTGRAEYPGGRDYKTCQREAQQLVIHEPAAGQFNLVTLVWTGVEPVATTRVLQGVRFPKPC